jgi:hypothetical protein
MDFALTMLMVAEGSGPSVSVFGFIHELHVGRHTLVMKRSYRQRIEDRLGLCDHTYLRVR